MPEGSEVPKLVCGEFDVESVSEEVVAEADVSQSVLHPFENPFSDTPQRVAAEIHLLQRNVGGGEQLGAQGLEACVPLTKLLDVEPPGQDGEVEEDGRVAVDTGGVDLVEAALAGQRQLGVELGAGDFQPGGLHARP